MKTNCLNPAPIFCLAYTLYDGFCFDLVTNELEGTFEAWLYHKHYGTKMLMFGVMQRDTCIQEFLDMVECQIDDYVELYEDNYFEEIAEES